MLKAFLLRQVDALERRWTYDASYMRHMIQVRPLSGLKFGLGTQAMNRADAPAEALVAAGLVGTLSEDCGPCTQISVDVAVAGGVDPRILRAILAGDATAMGETAALAWRFCRASLARDMEDADPLRDEIVRRWGDKGLLASPEDAARQVLAFLHRPDFGANPVADVRD